MTNDQAQSKQSSLAVPLQDGETILQKVHRHWIYHWPQMAGFLLVGLGPVILLGLLLDSAGGFRDAGAKIFWVGSAIYIAYWALRMFLAWYRYHNDVWVITNQRLLDISKRHPFNLRVATADLVNVQDMAIDRNGVIRTWLDYGDIVCQTASEQQVFTLAGIPNPRAVQALVDRERDRERMRVRG